MAGCGLPAGMRGRVPFSPIFLLASGLVTTNEPLESLRRMPVAEALEYSITSWSLPVHSGRFFEPISPQWPGTI